MLAPPPKGASFGRAWKPKDNDAAQERSLVAHCLALCAGCERCRFVSLSAQWNDCRCLGLGLGLGLRGLGVGLRGLGVGVGLELGLRHSPPTHPPPPPPRVTAGIPSVRSIGWTRRQQDSSQAPLSATPRAAWRIPARREEIQMH